MESKEAIWVLLKEIKLKRGCDKWYKCVGAKNIIEKDLERLEQIDNAKPSEALDRLEYICKILNEKRIDIKWLFKEDYTTIKQALIKAQEQDKILKILEKCEDEKHSLYCVYVLNALSSGKITQDDVIDVKEWLDNEI